MARFIHYAAIIVNLLAIITIIFFLLTMARGHEVPFLYLLMLPPVLALMAILDIKGPEERRLAKQVRLAKLKKELSELES